MYDQNIRFPTGRQHGLQLLPDIVVFNQTKPMFRQTCINTNIVSVGAENVRISVKREFSGDEFFYTVARDAVFPEAQPRDRPVVLSTHTKPCTDKDCTVR